MRRRQRQGEVILAIGIVTMVGIVIYGELLQAELNLRGVAGMEAAYGPLGLVRVLVFALGFPLGIALTFMGAALFTAGDRRAPTYSLLAVLVAASAPLLYGILGNHTSAWYFGGGGIALLVLIALSAWWWGNYRARAPDSARATIDLQGAGLACFAVAAWNLCGAGAMPGFALFPERLLALDSLGFAVGQMKVVMAFLVLGFLFSALGLRRALLVPHL
jgi:hypothetical protein